jgi:hypothetical protein
MLKKLIGLFLWFCAASMLALLCIVAISAGRGNFDSETLSRIIAMLNGMDIQAIRLKEALVSARETPTPSYEDVINAKVRADLDIDSRQAALDNYQRQIADRENKLRAEMERFDARRQEFKNELDKQKKNIETQRLSESMKIIENLSPDQAKEQLMMMLKNNEKPDVVAIIQGVPSDKQKKILAEFSTPEDQQKLGEILREVRNSTPIDNLINGTQEAIATP